MDLGEPIPPYFLPRVPTAGLIHASRDNAGEGLAHGLGGLPRPSLKFNTGGVYGIFPEVGRDLKVFLAQFHPLIECLSYEEDTDTCQTYF
jgi:hypothetical protein